MQEAGSLSRLSTFAATLTESAWLVAALATPIVFNARADRAFEEPKVLLLRTLAGIVFTGLVMHTVATAPETLAVAGRLRRHAVVQGLVALCLVYCVATLLSLDARVSFWGAHLRTQGTYTWGSYVVIFVAIVALVRHRDQIERLVRTLVLSSIVPALYAVMQRFDADPFRWAALGDRTGRVFGTAGNPIFLAAFLSMIVPLTIAELLRHAASIRCDSSGHRGWHIALSATYTLVLSLQLLALLWSRSRGPLLGLGCGLVLSGLVIAFHRRALRTFVALLAGVGFGVTLLIVVNVFNGAAQGQDARSHPGDWARVTLATGTGKVRMLIWQGALNLLAAHPLRDLVGYGPETTGLAYEPYTPGALFRYDITGMTPDRAHNETLDALVTLGVPGAAAQLFVFVVVVRVLLAGLGLLTTQRRRIAYGASALAGIIGGIAAPRIIEGSFTFSAVGLAFGLVVAVTAYVVVCAAVDWPQLKMVGRHHLILCGLLAGIVAHFVEIHIGIAVASTRLCFFILAALAVVLDVDLQVSSRMPTGLKHSGLLYTASVAATSIILSFTFARPGVPLVQQGLALPCLLATTWLVAALFTAESFARHRPGVSRLAVLLPSTTLSLGIWVVFLIALRFWNAAPAVTASDWDSSRALLLHLADAPAVLYGFVLAVPLITAAVISWVSPPAIYAGPAHGWVIVSGFVVGVVACAAANANLAAARADGLSKLASIYEERGALDGASALLEDAAREQPSVEDYPLAEGRVRLQQAKTAAMPQQESYFAGAEAVLQRARSLRPLNPDAALELARVHRAWAESVDPELRSTHLARARELYAEALQRRATRPALWNEWATMDMEAGNYDAAVEQLTRSLAVDEAETTRNGDTYCLRGTAWLQLGAAAKALADFESALARDPNIACGHSGRDQALARLNRSSATFP